MSEILVIADHIRGQLGDITLELIGAAIPLKDMAGAKLGVVVVSHDPAQYDDILSVEGVDEILHVTSPTEYFDASFYDRAIGQIVEERKASILVMPQSANGYAYGPVVAAKLGAAFASDVMGLRVEGSQILATKSIYENKVHMDFGFDGQGIISLMLRGATFPLAEGQGQPQLTEIACQAGQADTAWEHVEYIEAPVSNIDITKSEFILSIGRGIQDEEHVDRFASLADKLNATLGCSRPLADAGWLPKPHQVGLSGKMASNCKLYLALGISGAVQHLHGMKHVETIIAVNTDPSAPIFNVAKYGVCMDVFDFIEEFEKLNDI